MCILHQYHKASGLKACTAMCRIQNKCRKYIYLFQNGGAHVFLRDDGGGSSIVKEYEIITLKYNGKACRLYLLFFCAPVDIIFYAIQPGSTKFEGKYFYKLIQSKGEHKTKLIYLTYQTKFDAKMTKMKWNYTANMIMSVSVTVCHLIL